ncbi:MAG: pyridoxal-phosphate-dependent aminotransferase family protein, partial [Candidatus Dormibacteraceae bacterium]
VGKVFKTENRVLVYTSSGTGGLESALANLISPGDQVVACIGGSFGERFAAIAAGYGAEVTRLEVEWGQAIEPADLEQVLAAQPEAQLVLITHNETSTGVTNPLPELAEICRRAGKMVLVDGVSSVGSIPFEVDQWGIDVAVTASQKGFMAPPGLAFLSLSPRALARSQAVKNSCFYFDWQRSWKFQQGGSTVFTPAVSVFYGVQEGLRMLFEEGLENVYRRHRRLADAVADGLQALGFQLLVGEGSRSAVVTAARPPSGVEATQLLTRLRQQYGVVIAGGQGKMEGEVIRIGHLGAASEGDMVQVLWSLEAALREGGQSDKQGLGVAALTRSLVAV